MHIVVGYKIQCEDFAVLPYIADFRMFGGEFGFFSCTARIYSHVLMWIPIMFAGALKTEYIVR